MILINRKSRYDRPSVCDLRRKLNRGRRRTPNGTIVSNTQKSARVFYHKIYYLKLSWIGFRHGVSTWNLRKNSWNGSRQHLPRSGATSGKTQSDVAERDASYVGPGMHMARVAGVLRELECGGTGACADGKDWGVEGKFPGVAAYGHPPEGDGSRVVGRHTGDATGTRKVHGPRATGRSRGGWTIKVHKIADDAHCWSKGSVRNSVYRYSLSRDFDIPMAIGSKPSIPLRKTRSEQNEPAKQIPQSNLYGSGKTSSLAASVHERTQPTSTNIFSKLPRLARILHE